MLLSFFVLKICQNICCVLLFLCFMYFPSGFEQIDEQWNPRVVQRKESSITQLGIHLERLQKSCWNKVKITPFGSLNWWDRVLWIIFFFQCHYYIWMSFDIIIKFWTLIDTLKIKKTYEWPLKSIIIIQTREISVQVRDGNIYTTNQQNDSEI